MKFKIVSYLIFLIIISITASSQTIKEKNKPGKTKIKELPGTSQKSNNGSIVTNSEVSRLENSSWKFYIAEPINDTTIWRFAKDSSFIQDKKGEILVYSLYNQAHDTLYFHDIGGQYFCPSDEKAVYKITIDGNFLSLDLIQDDCAGRGVIINKAKLERVTQ